MQKKSRNEYGQCVLYSVLFNIVLYKVFKRELKCPDLERKIIPMN